MSDASDGHGWIGAASCSAWRGPAPACCGRWSGACRARACSGRRRPRRRRDRAELQLRPDQRHPHRVQGRGEPRRAGHLRGRDRAHQGARPQAGLPDPHRRHHPRPEGGRVRHGERGAQGHRRRADLLRPGRERRVRGRRHRVPEPVRGGGPGRGWQTFDYRGVHFVGLVNVLNFKAGKLGSLGADQLEWLERDLAPLAAAPRSWSSRTCRCGRSTRVGLGHRGRSAGARLSQAVRLGDRAQRPHPPDHAEGGGQRDVPHRAVHRLPAARPRRGTRRRVRSRCRWRSCAACWACGRCATRPAATAWRWSTPRSREAASRSAAAGGSWRWRAGCCRHGPACRAASCASARSRAPTPSRSR